MVAAKVALAQSHSLVRKIVTVALLVLGFLVLCFGAFTKSSRIALPVAIEDLCTVHADAAGDSGTIGGGDSGGC